MTTETEPVPASEHQRLQAEAAAMREALSSFKSAMGGFTISASSEYRDQLEALSTAYNKACAALSSDAGRPLLEERDELRKEKDELRDALACPNSEYGTHRCVRCDSEVAP